MNLAYILHLFLRFLKTKEFRFAHSYELFGLKTTSFDLCAKVFAPRNIVQKWSSFVFLSLKTLVTRPPFFQKFGPCFL